METNTATTQAGTAIAKLNADFNTPWDSILDETDGVLYGDPAANAEGTIVFEDDSVIAWDMDNIWVQD